MGAAPSRLGAFSLPMDTHPLPGRAEYLRDTLDGASPRVLTGHHAPGHSSSPRAPETHPGVEEPHVATTLPCAPQPAPKLMLVFLPQICFISLGA